MQQHGRNSQRLVHKLRRPLCADFSSHIPVSGGEWADLLSHFRGFGKDELRLVVVLLDGFW